MMQIEMSHLYNSSNKNSPHHKSSMTSIVNISVVIHNSKRATIFLILNTMIGSGILNQPGELLLVFLLDSPAYINFYILTKQHFAYTSKKMCSNNAGSFCPS